MLVEVEDFNKWLRRKNPQATTPIHYTNDLRLFFQWANKSPAQITVREIDRYIEHCQSLGHAVATINRRLAALRSFYNFLDLTGDERVDNPVRPKRHFIRPGRRLPRDVTDDVVKQFFGVIQSARDRAIFLLMLRCGLRIEEAHNLSLGDLYLHAGSTSLPRLWLHGKGNVERVVYLSAQAQAALETWLAVRPVSADPAVFLNRSGRRLSISGIQKRLAAYRREAGLHLSSHQLRHTFGRHLVEAKVPVTTIQRLLGHARLHTSELYMHISDPQVQADYQAAMAQIARRWSPEGGADE